MELKYVGQESYRLIWDNKTSTQSQSRTCYGEGKLIKDGTAGHLIMAMLYPNLRGRKKRVILKWEPI